MRIHPATVVLLALLLGGAASLGWIAVTSSDDPAAGPGGPAGEGPAAAAVEVAPVRSGTVRDVRVLSGTLEAAARFAVAAKVGGLVQRVSADLSDELERGQIIAQIDDQEYRHTIAEFEAQVDVARAELSRAESRLVLARSEHEREKNLRDQGVSSESEYDAALAALEAARADQRLAAARVAQSDAALELARLRLDDTRVRAQWEGGPDRVTVAERYVDAGETVALGEPILTAVTLDPLRAVVSVTERDYARLRQGQTVELTTDALPGRVFPGTIARIASVFRESSRQARVEITVPNPDRALRPGMFVRVRITLDEREADTVIPLVAVARRDTDQVVFVVAEDGQSVREVVVRTGIVDGEDVEILDPPFAGRVVTLGQQLLDDASPIRIAGEYRGERSAAAPPPATTAGEAAP